jgi:hypothetical protein
MTSPAAPGPPPASPGSTSRARRLQVIVIGLLAVAVLAGAFAIWYVFFRPAGPAALEPGAPVIPAGAVTTAPATLAP